MKHKHIWQILKNENNKIIKNVYKISISYILIYNKDILFKYIVKNFSIVLQ